MEVNEIKKIIISRTDKIGDLLLSIPSFFMARKMFPQAEIMILVRNYNYEIVKNLPYIDKILKIDDYKEEELENEIKNFNADVFIALYNDKIISKLARVSKARFRIGPISKIYSIFSFNKGAWQKRSESIKNEAYYNLDLIKKIDPKRYEELFEINSKIYLEDENISNVNMYMDRNKIEGKLLVVNPFMGGSAKTITDDQYSKLLQKIYDVRKDISIIITCHISEKERSEKILKEINREKVYVFANEGSVLNLAGMIDRADVYLGGSTGPTHLAGALGKKIVAIYPNKKTQHPIRWGVINNENVRYIIPDRPERNIDENYSKEDKYFKSYDETIEKEILDALNKSLG